MIRLFLLLAMGLSFVKYYQYNNFDEPDPTLPATLDTLNINNSWQIGPPDKTLFESAFSTPNVIVTDTLSTYPVNDSSSFTIALEEYYFWAGLPYIVVGWQQWLDAEQDVDGAVVEYAFDTTEHWINVFKDTITKPLAMNNTQPVVLFNGQMGMSGTTSNWQSVSFCWTESFISDHVETMYLRFTFYSDSVDTQQEGWMIDNIDAYPTLVDNTAEQSLRENMELTVFPNPASELINISWEENNFSSRELSLFDATGKLLKQESIERKENTVNWKISDLSAGHYFIQCKTEDGKIITKPFVKK